jgi:hypothetical protein
MERDEYGYEIITEGKVYRYAEAIARYDEMLDECYPLVQIGTLSYSPSQVLKKVDPIAYQCGMSDWLDSEELTTD